MVFDENCAYDVFCNVSVKHIAYARWSEFTICTALHSEYSKWLQPKEEKA